MEKYPIFDYKNENSDEAICEEIALISLDLSNAKKVSKDQEDYLNGRIYSLFGISETQAQHIKTLLN